MGFFDLPTVKRTPNGILAIVLCVIAGGLGTIIIGAIDDRGNNKKNVILVGVLQLVATLAFGLGWVWAVIWGVMVFMRSVDAPSATPAAAAAPEPAPAPVATPAKAPAKKAAAKPAAKKAAPKSAKKAAKK